MYLHLQKYGPSTCKSADADADTDAVADTDYCGYVLYNPSFCNFWMRIRMPLFRPLHTFTTWWQDNNSAQGHTGTIMFLTC